MASNLSFICLSPLLIISLVSLSTGRLIPHDGHPSNHVSDGVHSLFLTIVYGYLMYLAASHLCAAREMLSKLLGPGYVGGLFLPMLANLPDAMLILVSGISGTPETAQTQVSVGMGVLAGSTVMLLTVIWGSCIVVGKCDIDSTVATDGKDTKGLNLTGSGISTDLWTSYMAMIMAVSVIPFIVVQFPQILHSNSRKQLAVLIGLIISVSLLISYCIYQVIQPIIQQRHLSYAKHRHVRAGILKQLKTHALERLSTEEGTPNEEVLQKLFNVIDTNGDDHLSHNELKALLVGIQFNEINMGEDDAMEKVMKDFDTSEDAQVDFREFVNGIAKLLEEAKETKVPSHLTGHEREEFLPHFQQTKDHCRRLGGHNDESVEVEGNPKWTSIKAVSLLLLGTAIVIAFADPLVEAVDNFSKATNIPSFFISFVVLPIATSSREAVSAIIFATQKKLRSASLTFSELYGAVTIKNLLGLSVFLALVYARDLKWDFSSEVLVISIVCGVMGVFASCQTTFPLWTSLLAFSLYPISLVLVYVLDKSRYNITIFR